MDRNSPECLYRDMLRLRVIEETIADLYPQEQMRCPVHLCIGQEAIAVGVCAQLQSDDYVFSGHRSHGHYLAKGGDLKAMMAEIYGKAAGCSRGKGGSMHLLDLDAGFLGATPIVASTIPIAVGAAFGTAMRGEKRVTVTFFGEAATEEGTFHESIQFAALKKLPVVFICENNFFSVYSPMKVRQAEGREVYALARGHGVESRKADGNDVLEVSRLARQAVERARQGGGPSFLEFTTYRWREHCGPGYDNDLGYRTEAEFQQWKARCPVETMRRRLLGEGVLTDGQHEEMMRAINAEMAEAVHHAKTTSFPEESAYSKAVYAD